MFRFLRQLPTPVIAALVIIGCGGTAVMANDYLSSIDDKANDYKPNIPCLQDGATFPECSHDALNWERQYNLFENPATILWCTVSFSNPSMQAITFPVAHKLTSSSVSFWPSSRVYNSDSDSDHEYTPERRSGDGMYHGNPPGYRFGFTPGGRYIDIYNIEQFCTDAPTAFQKQETKISVSYDSALGKADNAAQEALGSGDEAKAEQILKDAVGGGK